MLVRARERAGSAAVELIHLPGNEILEAPIQA